MNAKRKQIEEVIYTIMKLDKTGLNYNKYKQLFAKMNDKQFEKFIKDYLADNQKHLTIEVIPYKNEPELNDIINVAKKLGIAIEEYVYFRTPIGDVRSLVRLPVGYVFIKKMQQFLTKKNTYATSISTRSMKFNQVTGKDKMAKVTEPELFSMVALGADKAIEEFFGPKSDNQFRKDQMYRLIARDGYVYLNDLANNVDSRQTMNIIDVYLTGMGIKSNLLSPGLTLRSMQSKDQTEETRTDKKKQ